MIKAAFIMDMPVNCEKCTLCVAVLGKRYCSAKSTEISKGEKDCACPLKELPGKQDIVAPLSNGDVMNNKYAEGWNAFRNKILEGGEQ